MKTALMLALLLFALPLRAQGFLAAQGLATQGFLLMATSCPSRLAAVTAWAGPARVRASKDADTKAATGVNR
ncbi:hypothetical protein [Zobellella sp. DQSA1]|uniref:hypothetical protein n=1 Tax=Zobellella sp. DQSA1 TaxID=3342386 RepID=UPI0035BEF29C